MPFPGRVLPRPCGRRGMGPEEALRRVRETFPIAGYVRPEAGGHLQVARTALRHLGPGAAVLDFASGPCDKTGVLQLLGFRCSACDDLQDHWHGLDGNRDKIRAYAARLGIDFRPADGPTLPFAPDSFDMVMAHHVLEHLHDSPRTLVNDLVRLIRPGGYLFLTVPNAVNIRKRLAVLVGRTNMMDFDFYYWYPGPWRGHVREYTRGDLRRLAAHLGVAVVELRGVDHLLHKLPGALRPLYRGATAAFRGFKDTWSLVARKPAAWTPREEAPREQLGRLLGPIRGKDS
jgi:SAM-dependent methyltransferase